MVFKEAIKNGISIDSFRGRNVRQKGGRGDEGWKCGEKEIFSNTGGRKGQGVGGIKERGRTCPGLKAKGKRQKILFE